MLLASNVITLIKLNMFIYCLYISKCTSSMNQLLYVLFYIYIHFGQLRTWPVVTVTIGLIVQSIVVHAQYIHHVHFPIYYFYIITTQYIVSEVKTNKSHTKQTKQ